jgi:hypothetical protein
MDQIRRTPLKHVAVPTKTWGLDEEFSHVSAVIYSTLVESNIVHPVTFGVAGQVSYFHKVFNIANGITKPKVLVCVGSDGIVRHT